MACHETDTSIFGTLWGRVKYICISKLTIIGSDNGLSPGRCQAIIWTNDGILLIGPKGTNVSEILNEIQTFSFKKMHLKMSSGKWQPFCLGLNVLTGLWYERISNILYIRRTKNVQLSCSQAAATGDFINYCGMTHGLLSRNSSKLHVIINQHSISAPNVFPG